MTYVHDKPSQDGLTGYYDYDEFSSYESLAAISNCILQPETVEQQAEAIENYRGLSEAIRRAYPTAEDFARAFFNGHSRMKKWWQASNDKLFGEKWHSNYRLDYFKFNRYLEESLIARGINPEYNAIDLDGDTIRDIVIGLSQNYSFSWAYICKRLLAKGIGRNFDRSALLASVITELVIKTENTFDNTLQGLGIAPQEAGLDVLLEVFWRINRDKGWSYEYISRLLGLEFPNTDFLAELILRFQEKNSDVTTANALAMLSVTDEPGLPLAWETVAKMQK